jgi:hypothetical protein
MMDPDQQSRDAEQPRCGSMYEPGDGSMLRCKLRPGHCGEHKGWNWMGTIRAAWPTDMQSQMSIPMTPEFKINKEQSHE